MRIMDDLMRTFARPDSESVGLSIIFAEIGLPPSLQNDRKESGRF
jgi:hypothetical protein